MLNTPGTHFLCISFKSASTGEFLYPVWKRSLWKDLSNMHSAGAAHLPQSSRWFQESLVKYSSGQAETLSFLNWIALEDFSGYLPCQGNHSVGLQKAPPGFWNKSTVGSGLPSLPRCCLATAATARNQPHGCLGGCTQPTCEQCHRDAPDTGKKSSKGPWLPLHGGALLCH